MELVQAFRTRDHEILIMGDFNEEFDSSTATALQELADTCDLHDLMALRLGYTNFSTCTRSPAGERRIDYALATSAVVQACTAAGYHTEGYLIQSDHRGLFMDFDTNHLFGNPTYKLDNPALRQLVSKHPMNCAVYVYERYKYMDQHRMFSRLEELIAEDDDEGSSEFPRAEQWDRDWVRSAVHAESECSRIRSTPCTQKLAKKRRYRTCLNKCLRYLRKGWDLETIAGDYIVDDFQLPTTEEEAKTLLRSTSAEIRKMAHQAALLRDEELKERIAQAEACQDKAGAKKYKHM